MFEKAISKFSLCGMKVKILEANYHATSKYMLNISNSCKKSIKPLLFLKTSNIPSLGEFVM